MQGSPSINRERRALVGAGLRCAGKLGNMSSPRPAHHGAIIPRSSRRVDQPVLDAWLVGGAAHSARTAAGAIQGTHCQQHCFFSKVPRFVAGTGHIAYQPSRLSNPLKTSHPLPQTPTQSTNHQVTLFAKLKHSVLLPAPDTLHTNPRPTPTSQNLPTLPQNPTQSANRQTIFPLKKLHFFKKIT